MVYIFPSANEEMQQGEWTLWTAGMYNVQEKIWLWYYQRAWQYKMGGLESPQVQQQMTLRNYVNHDTMPGTVLKWSHSPHCLLCKMIADL